MYAREVTTEGIVLARAAAGEGSARIVLYTEALGLVTALVKSSREERSKLRAHTQAGSTGTYRLVKGRDVWRVAGASETRNIFFELGEKPRAAEAAARVTQAVRQFVQGEGADETLFRTLKEFLEALPALPEGAARDAECVAVVKMLSALGYLGKSDRTDFFLASAYAEDTLARARAERASLLGAVNEAIGASGL